MNELFHFQKLKKTVQGQLLLDIDEFVINEQTCIALSGRNGAGKSTLLRIIAGLEVPDAATITFLGRTLPWQQTRQNILTHVIYLHQTPYLFDSSVSKNIAYGLHCIGIPSKDISERVSTVLQWAGLDHLASRNARELSGGERQRVALARARILCPRVLLLDEPTASMDSEAREQTWRMIRRLKNDGVSIVLSTHEYHTIAHLCDEHLCLEGGHLKPQPDIPEEPTRKIIPYN